MPLSFSSPMSSTSPVVDQVMEKKRIIHNSRSKIFWAFGNFSASLLLFMEAENPFLFRGSSWRTFYSRVEIALSLIFLVNAILDAIAHFFPFGVFGSTNAIGSNVAQPVSPQQRKLLSVDENDPLFGPTSKKQESKPSDAAAHPFGFPPPLEGSFIASSTPTRAPSHQLDFHNMSNTSMMSYSPSVVEVSSWLYYKPPPPTPVEQTSPKSGGQEGKKPTASPEGVITNHRKLKEFIASLEAKEEATKFHDANTSNPNNQNSSVYWQRSYVGGVVENPPFAQNTSPMSTQDYSPILKKLSYQVSSPMPNVVSPTGGEEGSGGAAQGQGLVGGSGVGKKRIAHTSTELICLRLGIDPLDLVSWMQNLRLWLSQTILARVTKEIETVNQTLAGHGISDLIGQVGIEKLRKCCQLVPEVATSINAIIPFIDITIHQDYLYHRLFELAKGGAIADYKWNAGSTSFKGQPWSDKYPTDCEIIINCFTVYMDNCMPANYSTAESKPFSNLYFVKAPETKTVQSHPLPVGVEHQNQQPQQQPAPVREKCVIVQAAQRPPFYYLQLQDDKLDVSPGRNNLFHTLLLFLHHIKTKEGGMLGRTNFNASGINILWIID